MATYRVLQTIEYPPSKRAEVGALVDDIPTQSIKWLLEQQIIEVAKEDKPSKKARAEFVEDGE